MFRTILLIIVCAFALYIFVPELRAEISPVYEVLPVGSTLITEEIDGENVFVFHWTRKHRRTFAEIKIQHKVLSRENLKELYVGLLGPVPDGYILYGLSETKRISRTGPVLYQCDIYMVSEPEEDTVTYDHEVLHCLGWVHQ